MSDFNNAQVVTADVQASISPSQAVDILRAGNDRFVSGNTINDRNTSNYIDVTAGGQWPFAAVLGCIDSRVPAEVAFDQHIGDIFNVRVAGNFINEDILGSLEYSCKVAGSKAIVVLGHRHCGAVKSACDGVELGNITAMLSKIQPAVAGVTDVEGDRNSSNAEFVANVAHLNVDMAIDNIKAQSPILNEMYNNGEIKLVAGMYDVESGKITMEER